tara:strand:+ start:4396 stop:4668 length:273 start_codon:yes stop_codon:yes gene_type:complete
MISPPKDMQVKRINAGKLYSGDNLTVTFKVKKRFYFWPVFLYLKLMVRHGRVSIDDASDFMAKRCVKVTRLIPLNPDPPPMPKCKPPRVE